MRQHRVDTPRVLVLTAALLLCVALGAAADVPASQPSAAVNDASNRRDGRVIFDVKDPQDPEHARVLLGEAGAAEDGRLSSTGAVQGVLNAYRRARPRLAASSLSALNKRSSHV